ncbi:MAG: hypothetical protein ABIH09_00300 [Candidatus Omnitrophota bacterium]
MHSKTGKRWAKVLSQKAGCQLVEGYGLNSLTGEASLGIYHIMNDIFIINPEEKIFTKNEILKYWKYFKEN